LSVFDMITRGRSGNAEFAGIPSDYLQDYFR
jgi:hypothetical protein